MDEDRQLNLKQVAAVLGVHYMTAYRYVRTCQLPAHRAENGWVIDAVDLAAFVRGHDAAGLTGDDLPALGADWRDRLRRTLVVGDEVEGWRVLEQALTAGATPTDCYLDILGGAIEDVSARTGVPDAPVAEEYLATATAARLVARMGARFRRPGRTRGTVVLGAVLGEHHTLALSIVADLVRLDGFTCLELGADVPPVAFAGAAAGAHRLVTVGIGVTTSTNLEMVRQTVEAVRTVDPRIPVLLGGQAAGDPAIAARTGATAWAADGRHAVSIVNELAHARRAGWSVVEGEVEGDGEGSSEGGQADTA